MIFSLAGCANSVQYRVQALPLPPRPVVAPIAPEALACLTTDTLRALVIRQQQCRDHVKQLETIIKATHQDANN